MGGRVAGQRGATFKERSPLEEDERAAGVIYLVPATSADYKLVDGAIRDLAERCGWGTAYGQFLDACADARKLVYKRTPA